MAIKDEVRQVERWLSAGEAGHILGTSATWVSRLAREGRIEGVYTSLGWLLVPESVKKEARRRKEKARKQQEKKDNRQQALC